MSAIETLLRQPAAQAIGWALLHFVWQGALVAALTAVALAALRKSAADVRYVVSTIALSLMLTLPAVTAAELWRLASPDLKSSPIQFRADASAVASPVSTPHAAPAEAGSPLNSPVTAASVLDSVRVDAWLPVIVFGWLCGVVVLSLRLMSSWLWVQRMKSHGTLPARDGWQLIATRLSRRLHIARGVTLLESMRVDVPTVIGWLKPVVLLPASALAGLTPHQLEAILAHELAHIRRHDYLVNLLQTLVETLLFYHPAVWWLSSRIRTERENCCDDLAVSLCGDPFTYAQALADLEERRGSRPQFAMAASGGSLVQRVRRLLGAPTHAGRAPGWLAGSASILVMLGIVASAVGTNAFQTTQAAAPPAPAQAATTADRERAVRRTQSSEEAQAVLAAAQAMTRTAKVYGQAARAAAWVEDQTGHATTPVLAGQALAARAAAFQEAANSMAAQATAAPVLAGPSVSKAFGGAQSHGNFVWQHDADKLEVRYDGEVEFTDDDTDVKRLSPGGLLRIKDGGFLTGLTGHTIEFTADGSGNLTRRYWVGPSERPFEPEGRQWLAKVLPRFIRQTGIGAPARVARILRSRGPAGVLAEISQVEGSWAKRVYFNELLKTPLDANTARQTLVQAGREIDSDFELTSLLIQAADKLLVDEGTRHAYFDAARTIQSDFEMHRVYAAALKRGPVSPAILASILNASRDIDSDFEEASLLVQIAKLQPLDNTARGPFFDALATVSGDFEHHRVLSALAERTDLTPEVTGAMLASVAALSSDFEAASFLMQIVKDQPIEGTLRSPFFRAVDSIDSAFERGRVLQTVARRPDASPETILAVLRATAAIKGSFEASNVLLAVAATHPVAGAARDAYIDAAEKLGDFEQGRVLSALVRNERRR